MGIKLLKITGTEGKQKSAIIDFYGNIYSLRKNDKLLIPNTDEIYIEIQDIDDNIISGFVYNKIKAFYWYSLKINQHMEPL